MIAHRGLARSVHVNDPQPVSHFGAGRAGLKEVMEAALPSPSDRGRLLSRTLPNIILLGFLLLPRTQ